MPWANAPSPAASWTWRASRVAGAVNVKQDKSGTWYCRLYLGRSADGKKLQAYKSFPEARGREDARLSAVEWAAGLTAGGQVASMRLDALLAEYIDMKEANGVSPNSIRQYRLFAKYAAKHFGAARADELTALDFTRFSTALMRRGGRDGNGLSANTVNACYQFLRAAYGYFSAVGIVGGNPLLSAAKPSAEQREAIALGEGDVAKLTAWLDEALSGRADLTRAERAVAFCAWVALHTGMRAGEVCALRPCDVNAHIGFAHVGGTVVEPERKPPERKPRPKSSRSRRNVSMVADEMDVLGRMASLQAAEFPAAGDSAPLITVAGGWMRPSTLRKGFKRICESLGIDGRATFHTLRHTHASWCLAHGVDIVTLSERLGHASPAITIRVYGHMMAGRDMAAAQAFYDAALAAGNGAGKEHR